MGEHLEEASLRSLNSQLGGDHALQQRFVGDFVALWAVRIERLERALDLGRLDDADVVLLSIRSSSRMVGAVRLEAVAALVHGAVLLGDVPGCRAQLAGLESLGADACRELTAHFGL
ncbi:Hpt domain-containing protein [Cryobacterium melibiosiphilum]|uniref:Hpt domain-containing protein n=1 Tax=Cryobacterium melibiosiphilum TaxID=995039 RepID=A0A3A5MQD1_9MICO|nr:Hpt domain-containing protein [Cryobacterium melibiosiphilum]RJT92310.1 Hpt domain-containing protein [Cryobacterium melibiosiphilum]